MNKKMKFFSILGLFVVFLISMNSASAVLVIDKITFDPAIVSAGDEVDLVIQYHDRLSFNDEDMVGDSSFTFDVLLEADDTLTEDYVLIQDSKGDSLKGIVYAGENYNKVFRVKVAQDAPSGNYQFKLTGQWYEEGVALDNFQTARFDMPVKKEGILLDVASVKTMPGEVRSGDNYVTISASIENSGTKDAKSIELNLITPDGFESSYSDTNRAWVGRLNAGETKEVVFYIDVDDYLDEGLYQFKYNFSYADIDDNTYSGSSLLPFRVKSHPFIDVVNVTGEGLAGSSSQLKIVIKNTGTESAESVDVRLLKQNSQPFDFDVRSDYVGELIPGEEGVAIFDIDVNSDASIKKHDFKVLIRAKGDSDEGDDNIYTFNRRAIFNVTGAAPNILKLVGIGGAIIVFIIFGISKLTSGNKKGKKHKKWN